MEKILLVSRNFPPLVGGMERLNQHVLQELAPDYAGYLIGPSGAHEYAPTAKMVVTCPARPIHLFLIHAIFKSIWLALRTRPRLVIAGSGTNSWPAWLAARLSGARLVVYLHGLDIVANSFWYRHLFLPIIRRADAWLVNSHATARLAVSAGMDPRRIHVLHPGVEVPETPPNNEALAAWRTELSLDDRPVMLSVGRLTRRKGLTEFVRHVLPAILVQMPEAVLVIVGEEPAAALAAKGALHELNEAIRKAGANSNVRFLGKLPDSELAIAYAAADVQVFPVLGLPGDIEGFGMVAVEAAAYGTPSVAFAVGGVSDAISEGQSGRLIHPGDYFSFASAVLSYLGHRNVNTVKDRCREHAKQFAWPHFGKRLLGIISKLLETAARG